MLEGSADMLATHLEWRAMRFLFRIGKCGDPLSIEDRFPILIPGLDESTGIAPRQCLGEDRR